jgi:hypothetical protein
VPLGVGAERIQPGHSAREYIAAGVLGPHRVCVRTFFHLAERAMQHSEGDRRTPDYFPGDGGSFAAAHAMEKAAS